MDVTQPGNHHGASEPVWKERRKGPVEQVIESIASSLGNTVGFMAETGILFVTFALMWAAFGAALIWSQGSIDAAWSFIRGLPILVQALVWLLFLPVMLGLWVWETTWPVALRLLLVIGIGGWNLIVFAPRALLTGRP